MNRKLIIVKFLYKILVGIFFSTNIFLYAQNNEINADFLDNLVDDNEIDILGEELNKLYKDSINYNLQEKGKLYYYVGICSEKKDDEDQAFKYLKKAEKIFENLGEYRRLAKTHNQLYYVLENRDKEKAKIYLNKFYNYSLKNNDKKLLINAYFNFAEINIDSINFYKSIEYYNKAIILSKEFNDTLYLAKAYNNKAIILSNFYGNQDSTRYYYQKALNLYNKIKKVNEEFVINLNIGTSYKNEKKYQQAIKCFLQASNVEVKKYKHNFKRILYANLANSYKEIKNYKKAYHYFELYDAYKDSVNIEEQNVAIADLDKKYQLEKKENENLLLRDQKRTRDFYIIGISSVLIGLLIFGILTINNLRKRKEIAEKNAEIEHQLVLSLVNDQQIISMDAMVEGQEQERKRIAEDLHDNLGSTLATLKLHFDNYRENISINNEKQLNLLNSTENILNEAYSKVRTMAHTNNSSEIDNNNLIDALNELVNKVSIPGKTMFEFIEYGFDKSINNSLELIVFRTIQELMTNIVKHAKATKATIDVTLFEDSISLIVEDNGIGFKNKNFLETGMGLGSGQTHTFFK